MVFSAHFESMLVALSCLVYCIGLFLNVVIISYFNKKTFGEKTPFDLVVKDFIYANIVQNSAAMTNLILGKYFYPLPFEMAMAGTVVNYLTMLWLIASCIISIATKFAYVRFTSVFLEKSDEYVRYGSLCLKLGLAYIFLLLDQYGPMKAVPFIFKVLSNEHKRYLFVSFMKTHFID